MTLQTGKDTAVSDEYCAEVQQVGGPRQQQDSHQQKKPGEQPDGQDPEQPPLSHLTTLPCEQGQLDGIVTADPTRLSPPDTEDQSIEKR